MSSIWIYLAASPLFWLTVTVAAYVFAVWVARQAKGSPLANTVLIASVPIVLLLVATHTPYPRYFEGAQFVQILLGPATIALAVPLYRNLHIVRRALLPIVASLIAGSVTAAGSAVLILMAFHAPHEIVASVAAKSTTTPIAMQLSANMGGIPSLTAVVVILTGILGAVAVTPLMNALKIRNYAARGFAVGVASHGIGTARAFQVNDLAGTFSGIAMGLNGAATSLFVTLWIAFFGG